MQWVNDIQEVEESDFEGLLNDEKTIQLNELGKDRKQICTIKRVSSL